MLYEIKADYTKKERAMRITNFNGIKNGCIDATWLTHFFLFFIQVSMKLHLWYHNNALANTRRLENRFILHHIMDK